MPPLIDRHPWLPFLAAFLLLIGAWATIITVALKNRPEQVPLEHLQPGEEAEPPRPQPADTSNPES